jgi:hypothetical protein
MKFFDWCRRKDSKHDEAPRLRNVPGGMAWIRNLDDVVGSAALNGRAVRTVRLHSSGKWEIEPPQGYLATVDARLIPSERIVRAGDAITVVAICDECLEPWQDTGLTESEVRELFAPRLSKEAV